MVLLICLGVIIIFVLYYKNIKGLFVIGMFLVYIIGMILGVIKLFFGIIFMFLLVVLVFM